MEKFLYFLYFCIWFLIVRESSESTMHVTRRLGRLHIKASLCSKAQKIARDSGRSLGASGMLLAPCNKVS